MLRLRGRRYLAGIRAEFDDAIAEDHTPWEVAFSFAVGVFVTVLPTLGAGVVVLFSLAYLFASVSKVALFASVLVFNPLAKWGVYAVSFWLGTVVLGPTPGVALTDVSLSATPEIVSRLLVGNAVVAVVFAVLAYVVSYHITAAYLDDLEGVLER